MIDHRKRQSDQVNRERRAFIEEVSQEQAILKARRKQYPEGSGFFWALGGMYGPIGSARKIETATGEGEQAA